MKKIIGVVVLLFLATISYGQGINFETSSSWEEIQMKAKQQNKYIFVDCYATWCAPCKEMDQSVFVLKDLGLFFDEHFVSLKIQFDNVNRDSSFTSSLARDFEKHYEIRAYPCYLFFDPNGRLVAKENGAMTAGSFLQRAKSALNPNEQYFTIREKFFQGERNPDLIKHLALESVRLEDWATGYLIHNDFVKLLDSPYTKTDLITVYSTISNSSSLGYTLLLNNIEKINTILDDKGRTQSVIKSIISREAYDLYIKGAIRTISWKQIREYVQSKAFMFADEVVMEMKINYAKDKKNWEEYSKLKINYYDKYASSFNHNSRFFMNNELMEIFLKCSNKRTLERASQWSKKTIYREQGKESPAAMDTYANLLYKIGKLKEAIWWQERALNILSEDRNSDNTELKKNLDKMKLGLPTWIN